MCVGRGCEGYVELQRHQPRCSAWPAVQFKMFKGVQFVARLLNSMVGYVYIFKIILKAHVVRSN